MARSSVAQTDNEDQVIADTQIHHLIGDAVEFRS